MEREEVVIAVNALKDEIKHELLEIRALLVRIAEALERQLGITRRQQTNKRDRQVIAPSGRLLAPKSK